MVARAISKLDSEVVEPIAVGPEVEEEIGTIIRRGLHLRHRLHQAEYDSRGSGSRQQDRRGRLVEMLWLAVFGPEMVSQTSGVGPEQMEE